jgi:sporulation protein YlmC with PRC-barrel domain
MVGIDDIAAWRGQQVIDPDGEQLGKLEDVLFDTGSGTPLLLVVKSGLLGRKSSLIPVEGATVGPDYVRVAHAKEAVDRAGTHAGDELPDGEALGTIGGAYGLRFADRVNLESAGRRDEQRAEAEAARARAENLEAEAREKIAAHDAARERAHEAGDTAGQAERDAEQSRQAALEARREADRYGQS